MATKKTESSKLGELEKKKLEDVVKACTEEEHDLILRVVPDDALWDELIRRNTSMVEGVDFIAKVLGASLDNINPISAKAWSEIKARYDDLKERYNKVKMFSGDDFE